MVFTPSGMARRLDENTSYAVHVASDDSDRDVDYLATYRGHKLDCPLLPPPFDPNCTSRNDGWTIRHQLYIDTADNGVWVDTEYYTPAGGRLNVALSIRIKTLKVPNPPRWLTVLNEIGTVRLGWRAPITSGARAVTAYRHRQRINVDPPAWSDWVESKEDLYHYTITGLTTGTEYAFQVQAGNDGGWSKAAKVRTTNSEPLGAPTLTATANADGSIGLTWTHDDAPVPRGYEVRWKRNTHGWDGNPGGDEQMHYCSVAASNYTITGGIGNLENSACSGSGAALKTDGTVYDIEVRTAVIKGAPDYYFIYSQPATASLTPLRTAPTAPRTLAADAGEKHVTLSWTEPATVGSYPVTDYEYRYKETAGTAWSEWRGTVPTTDWCPDCDTWFGRVDYWQRNSKASEDSHAVVGLADGTSYDFEMRAVNELSNSSEPSSVSATPISGRFTEIEQTPVACHVIPHPASEWDVTCYWVAGSGQRSYADMKLLGYEVEGVKRDPDTGEISYELNTGDIPSMARHKDGGWEVARVSPSGRSAPQNVAQTPGMPGLLEASAAGGRIDLAWLTTYPPSTSYDVQWSADGRTGWQEVEPPNEDSDTIYSHSGLTGSTVYYYWVRGVNEHGSGRWSAVADATTGAQTAPLPVAVSPGAPTDLTASAGATAVALAWTAPVGVVTGYEVEWSDRSDGGWQGVDPAHSGTDTRYSDTELDAGTTRYYRVRAVNDAGSGEWSGPEGATTDEPEPEPLTAQFTQAPAEHEGPDSTFTLRLVFSEAVTAGYRNLRDQALTATTAAVRKVARVNGSSAEWEVTVAPSSSDAVTVSVSGGSAACRQGDAVCAEDGRRLSNSPSVTVAGPPTVPLTAELDGVPAEHDGERTFTFGLTFSEEPRVGFRTLRDEAFEVDGGAVRQARRRQSGSNVSWTITIQPSSHQDVSVRLPGTGNCSASGAICTDDGRPLSHSLSASVRGLAAMSVSDARVEEAVGAVVAFAVTLSRTASDQVTVDYRTRDASAQAGEDYEAASGTLTFQAGESSKTIEVTVLDDAHDEGEETFVLALSNASGAWLEDAEATGTIENTDLMPAALLARFGRATAEQVVEHVERRMSAPRSKGFRGRFAGRELRPGMGRDGRTTDL